MRRNPFLMCPGKTDHESTGVSTAPLKMIYKLFVDCSYKREFSRQELTFTSTNQVVGYIRSFIDQPYVQSALSDVEYAELDMPKDDFLPLPSDIDEVCDRANKMPLVVFEAGEDISNAQLFGVVFRVMRFRLRED